MLRLAFLFLVLALIAAFLGFGGMTALSWQGAKILFVVFLILSVLSLWHGLRRQPIGVGDSRPTRITVGKFLALTGSVEAITPAPL